MEKLETFLPKKEKSQLVLVQAKVPKKLKEETLKELKARNLTWNDLIVAAMRQILNKEKK